MNSKTKPQNWREKGLTLIEMALGLSLMAIVLAGITAYKSTINQELQLRQDAKYLNVVVKSATAYLEYERHKILATAQRAGTFPFIQNVPLDTLKSGTYLPSILTNTFSKGRTIELRTRVIKDSNSPGGFSVHGILITRGGTEYSLGELGSLANMVQGLPGFADPQNTNSIAGVKGSWQTPTTDWPGVTFGRGQLVTMISGDNAVAQGIGINQRWQSVPYSGKNNTDKTIMIIANANFLIPWLYKIINVGGLFPVGMFPGNFCLGIDVGSSASVGETCVGNNSFDYRVTTKALVPPGEEYLVHTWKNSGIGGGSPNVTSVFALQ